MVSTKRNDRDACCGRVAAILPLVANDLEPRHKRGGRAPASANRGGRTRRSRVTPSAVAPSQGCTSLLVVRTLLPALRGRRSWGPLTGRGPYDVSGRVSSRRAAAARPAGSRPGG